jgi:hypothetical protein
MTSFKVNSYRSLTSEKNRFDGNLCLYFACVSEDPDDLLTDDSDADSTTLPTKSMVSLFNLWLSFGLQGSNCSHSHEALMGD